MNNQRVLLVILSLFSFFFANGMSVTSSSSTTNTVPTTPTSSTSTSTMSQQQETTTTIHHERPALVQQALERNQPLYYFGLGSNMLRSKLENRSSLGEKIELLSFQPAKVLNHRLAFNMRGFVPLEPAMGSLEPVVEQECIQSGETPSKPLLAYHKPECHGALVQLTAENYELVMASEGISKDNPNPGYEEVVVTAIPYDPTQKPVQAVALRARSHVRLLKDPAPSVRYMTILREGAAELQLDSCYQDFLACHPVQQTPDWLKRLAIHNLIFTFTINSWSFGFKKKPSFPMGSRSMISKLQTWLLFQVYVPPNRPKLLRGLSDVTMATILVPGSLVGVLIRLYRHVTKTEHLPFVKRILGLMSTTTTTTSSSDPSTTTTAAAKEEKKEEVTMRSTSAQEKAVVMAAAATATAAAARVVPEKVNA